MSFIATYNKGFQMKFDNGFSISVQWGTHNYCERKSFNTNIDPVKERIWESMSAEIAVFDSENKILPIGNEDSVIGWLTPDEVAKIIAGVSSAESRDEIVYEINKLKKKGALL
tara:strand:- start:293 stop:631 length:339 start_codon:yes stop_codon:yes gene_type:complete